MSSQITYARMEQTLQELGFSEMRRIGDHVVFEHGKTGAVLSVPVLAQSVPSIYVNTAARQISNSGIATTEDFKRRLANGVTKAAS